MSEALFTLLADAVPSGVDVVVLGFEDDARAAMRVHSAPGTVLFVDRIADLPADTETLLAGPGWEAAFSETDERTFVERLARLAGQVRSGATMVVALDNPHSTARLLTATPRALASHDVDASAQDETRPASPRAFTEALRQVGFAAASIHSLFGTNERWCVLDEYALEAARTADSLSGLVASACSAVDRAPVLPAEQFTEALAAANALFTAADAFVAVVGGRGRSIYLGGAGQDVQWLDGSAADRRWVVGGSSDDPDRPSTVALAPTAHRLLLTAAAASDTGAFRDLATRLAQWVATSSSLDSRRDLTWRDVVVEGDTVSLTLGAPSGGHAVDPLPRDELLCRCWSHFVAAARIDQPELPWPDALTDDELVHLWLSMSGVGEERVRELVEGRARATTDDDGLWAARHAAAAATRRIAALEDEIAALQATLRLRDTEMAVRARAIRSLRGQVLSASKNRDLMAKANADIKGSAAFKLASQFRKAALITRPKLLVRELGKAADTRVRALRRAG